METLDQVILEACESQAEWPLGVIAAVDATIAFAAGNPAEMRLLLAASHAASDPQLVGEGIVLQERLSELLASGARNHEGGTVADCLTAQGSIGAALAIVGTCLTTGSGDALASLNGAVRAGLVQMVLGPYLGEQEAQRLAAT